MPRKVAGKQTTEQLSIRIPAGLREFIEWDVEENKEHITRNEWMIRAVEHYKEYRLEQIMKTKQIGLSGLESEEEEKRSLTS